MLLFFPVSYIESVITSLLILAALFLLPRGLIREKRKPIKGRVYKGSSPTPPEKYLIRPPEWI
jgi:hypothetical protein